jgi:hypothetical protein
VVYAEARLSRGLLMAIFDVFGMQQSAYDLQCVCCNIKSSSS